MRNSFWEAISQGILLISGGEWSNPQINKIELLTNAFADLAQSYRVFLEGLELVNADADLFVLVQGGQFGGDLALDPVDHVLGLLLGQSGLDGDLDAVFRLFQKTINKLTR